MPRAAHIDIGSSSSIWHCLEHTCAQWPVAFTLALYMWETDPPRALACAHVWCLSPLSTTRSKVRQAQSTAQSISCATGPSRPHFRLRVRGGQGSKRRFKSHSLADWPPDRSLLYGVPFPFAWVGSFPDQSTRHSADGRCLSLRSPTAFSIQVFSFSFRDLGNSRHLTLSNANEDGHAPGFPVLALH